MNSRGVNPFIVTSILVGLTLVIGTVIFSFGIDIQQDTIDSNTYDLQELGLVKFSARYSDAECSATSNNHCYRIFISNDEDFPMKFVVKTSSPLGTHVTQPDDVSLGAYEQKFFEINYPSSLGEEKIYAEINPVVEKN